MNFRLARAVEVLRSEVVRRHERHVAVDAARLGHGRVIEAAGAVPGDAGEQERIVVVLPANEVFVMVQPIRQADFVAGGAEFDVPMHLRLEEGAFVHFRLGFDQGAVDPLQKRIVAEGERVVRRVLDRIVGIAACAAHMGDGLARRAGDARLASGVFLQVKIRVVELAREERHRVVATGTPPSGLHAAVALQADFPRFLHAGQIGRVVERAEVVRRVKPAVIGVLMALFAVVVHHERLRRDERRVGRHGFGGEEVFLALSRPLTCIVRRVGRVQNAHRHHQQSDHGAPALHVDPLDARARPAVADVKADRKHGRDEVRPIADLPDARVANLEAFQPHEHQARNEHHDADAHQGDSAPNGGPIRTLTRRHPVRRAEDEKRHDQHEAQEDMNRHHQHVEGRLLGRFRPPCQHGDAQQVQAVAAQHAEPQQHHPQEGPELRADGGHVNEPRSPDGRRHSVLVHISNSPCRESSETRIECGMGGIGRANGSKAVGRSNQPIRVSGMGSNRIAATRGRFTNDAKRMIDSRRPRLAFSVEVADQDSLRQN